MGNLKNAVLNNTKWEEIRIAMYLYKNPLKWRTKDVLNGYISYWDADWYYHFKNGGYETIEWLEIQVKDEEQKNDVLCLLKKINVPGEVGENSIFVFGYAEGFVDYL